MDILNHLKTHHVETVKCALTLHNLMESEKGTIISRRKLQARLSKLQQAPTLAEWEEKYKLAQFAKANDMLEDDSLMLAKDICKQLGITEDEFMLASEYKSIEQKHLH